MRVQARRGKRLVLAGASATLLVCVMPAVTSAALPGTVSNKTCVQINGCSTTLSTPSRVTAVAPGQVAPPPAPSSRFGIKVATAPTATVGTQSQSGQLIEKLDPGRGVSCRGYTERDPTTFVFKVLTATPFRITYVIVDRIANTTADGIQFCLAANFGFRTASGSPAAPTVLPDGTRGHVGLLPRCANPAAPPVAAGRPCVAHIESVKDKTSSTGVDVILRVRVPTRTGVDPWGSS